LHIGLTEATCKTLPFQNPDLQKTGQATARKRTKKPHEDEEVRPTLRHAPAVSERLDYQFVDKDGIKNINEVLHRQIYSKSEILYVSASHYHQGTYNLETRSCGILRSLCWYFVKDVSGKPIDRIFKVPVLLDP
jgi:hypothetical protein